MSNREIKFRAWDKVRKRWFPKKEPFEIYLNGKYLGLDPWRENYRDWNNKYVLCQYTGLKDKNGKEIFEGDIIKDRYHRGEVLFGEHDDADLYGTYQGWYINNKMYPGEIERRGILNMDSPEIIGNVYENPELSTTK